LLFAASAAVEQVSTVLMRLNLATRRCHVDVDQLWLDLMCPNVRVPDYLGVLVRTYGVIAPFESACRYMPGLARIVDFKQLMRAGLIAQDLLSLGLSPLQVATVPQCPSITMFRGMPEALGWLYVIERSTLLQNSVRRHLQRHLEVDNACAYLAAYEGHVNDHWNAFGRVLDRIGHDAATANEIIRASCDAFDECSHWLRSTTNEKRNVG
jgi:heme oxygenase (biliverdin-IX-beta and delta-forming)